MLRRAGGSDRRRRIARIVGAGRDRGAVPITGGAWADLARVALGATVVAVTWREAAANEIPAWEQPVFEAVNQLPEGGRLLWPVMQFGSFAAVPVVTLGLVRITGDRRFALSVGAAGLAAYLGAKVVKKQVGRGRPADVFDEIVRREDASGYGYPSGHAAEAAAMATVIASRLPLVWQWVPVALVSSVSTGRLFFGAHLPHDVIGGAAMGAALGGSINLVNRATGPPAAAATEAP